MHRVFPASHCISLAPVPCLKQATGHGGYAVVLPGLCGGVWLCAVSRLAFVVASHAVLTWRAGEGGGLILPALAKSAPTLPSPPRHPGTARCAACGYADNKCGLPSASWPHRSTVLFLFPRDPSSGAGSPLVRAQSKATSARISRARQHHPTRQTSDQSSLHPSVRKTAHPLNGRRAK